ncbi:hypothetical protein B296_00042044 [Ensete ventricosum]|uniref:Uncharacterized protein n=1 Tax=Ensete ventricosum TaxID=4639 RepID=A0A426YSC5_ENSVE|nr:hypothetical protein B296_00042044 [Ensete ventricosum]
MVRVPVNHQTDAAAAYRYVKKKRIFGEANVRFWFDVHENYRKEQKSDDLPVPLRRLIIVRASSETDGKGESEPEASPSEGSEEAVSVENLPLESKLQLKLEQKLRMKLAKKIRLRRKRLLRKRRMRKKGRWPPSKMKKLKNV